MKASTRGNKSFHLHIYVQRCAPVPCGEIKLHKKMKSIKQIGNAALIKHFFQKDNLDYSQRILTLDTEFDLNLRIDSTVYKDKVVEYFSGQKYFAWSIIGGLQDITLCGDTLLEALASLGFLASHLIVNEWTEDEFTGFNETYSIYRISQKQEDEICKNKKNKW